MDVERRFAAIESRLADIEAQLPTFATKAEVANLEIHPGGLHARSRECRDGHHHCCGSLGFIAPRIPAARFRRIPGPPTKPEKEDSNHSARAKLIAVERPRLDRCAVVNVTTVRIAPDEA